MEQHRTCISQEQKLHKYSDMLKWPKEGEEVKLTLTLELSVRNLSIDFVKLLHRPHRWVFPP